MKKIISKILIIFILITILFEFVYSSNICYATFDINGDNVINLITNLMGGIVSTVLWIPRILVMGIVWTFDEIMTTGFANSCGINYGSRLKYATPFDIFFNKYKIFDINFFNIGTEDHILNKIRGSVAEWFYTMRLLSSAILLGVLIYVGIRMALSTVADEKAKYKKMFADWVASFALMFLLPYIIQFTMLANNAIVNFLKGMTYNDITGSINKLMLQATLGVGISSLVATFVYAMIVFQTISFMLAYTQRMLKVGFLIIISPLISVTYSIDKIGDGKAQALNTWLKEFVYTILIQPFHCLLYLAFANTAIGLINTVSAPGTIPIISALASMEFNHLTNGVLAILCLKFINDGEKAIRKIFNFKDDGNMTSMAAGTILAMSAINNAKNIGSTTVKGVNMVKGKINKFSEAFANDKQNQKLQDMREQYRERYNNSAIGKTLNNITSKAGTMVENVKNKAVPAYQQTKGYLGDKTRNVGKVISRHTPKILKKGAKFTAKKGRGLINAGVRLAQATPGKVKDIINSDAAQKILETSKASLPVAAKIAAAAFSYAGGSSGILSAIGTGAAFEAGTREFLNLTSGSKEKDIAKQSESGEEESFTEMVMNAEEKFDELYEQNANETDLGRKVTDIEYTLTQEEDELPLTEEELRGLSPEEIEEKEKEKEKAIKNQRYRREMAKQLALGSKDPELQNIVKANFLQEYRSSSGIRKLGSTPHGKRDFTNKVNEIMKKMLDLKSKADLDKSISDDDVDDVDRKTTDIRRVIDRSVLNGTKVDLPALLQEHGGFTDDGSDEYRSLHKAFIQYTLMKRAEDIDKTLQEAEQVELDMDDIIDGAARRRNLQ